MIEKIYFDMDGVLYDSMPNHAIAWQESMARFQIHMTAEDAYATEGARGVDTIRMMVRIQQQREIDEPEAQKMYDELVQAFAKEEGCTEQLKATDQMLWVRKMNNAAQRAREIVNAKIIYN